MISLSFNLKKNINTFVQASAQNSESDNQKEEKLVMEKKIGELEDKLRVRWTLDSILTLLTYLPF